MMLQRLRGRMGKWFDLARLLPALHSQGYDSNAVEEIAGLEKRLQGVWQATVPVYDSLKESHSFPQVVLVCILHVAYVTLHVLSHQATHTLCTKQEKLGHFDYEGEHLLYEIRLLTAQQRADVAEYVVDNRLGPAECNALARAVKEYERRRSEREGFSAAPGDVLAFKYYRDAAECRREEEKRRCIDRGLDVAVSEGARRRLVRVAVLSSRPMRCMYAG